MWRIGKRRLFFLLCCQMLSLYTVVSLGACGDSYASSKKTVLVIVTG